MSKTAPTAAILLAAAVLSLQAGCGPSGKINVNLSVDLIVERCPLVTSWAASPLQTSAPDGTIHVEVTAGEPPDAGDAGMKPLEFMWSATAGSFSDPTLPTSVYKCTTAGTQTLTASVTDVHRRVPCADVATMSVTCKSVKAH
jgi:hypothetical protein